MKIALAQVAPCTEAEGPGKRFALWVKGCPFRCPGCCNPHLQEFGSIELTPLEDVFKQILDAKIAHNIQGVTFIGGEPMAHAEGLGELARLCQEHDLSVMVFSGYKLKTLKKRADVHIDKLLSYTDLLVDGLYVEALRTKNVRFVGSTNQEIHALTPRYKELVASWEDQGANTVEFRIKEGVIHINGYPITLG